jgi:hypothetical protein
VHLRSAPDAYDVGRGRRVEAGRAGHQRDLGAAQPRLLGERKPHPAARSVPHVAHGIDVLVGWTRRHQHAAAAQGGFARRQHAAGRLDDLRRLGQPALANPAAREIPLARLDEAHAARGQRLHVPLHRLVRQHVAVHRRRQQHRGARRQVERGQEIVGDAVGELADDVGGARRDEQQRDAVGNRYVLDVGVHPGPPLRRDHRPPCDGLEGHRADETGGRPGHHGDDVVAALLQAAAHLHRLVGADAAGDAERDQRHGPPRP